MVYISSWQEYQEAAEALYAKSPEQARYCVKWKASEGKLVLKITDDTTCLKYKTHSSIFLNRFEALNLSLMQKMQNRRPRVASAEPEQAKAPAGLQAQSEGHGISRAGTPQAGASSATPAAGGPAGGGVKKKKGKKKK